MDAICASSRSSTQAAAEAGHAEDREPRALRGSHRRSGKNFFDLACAEDLEGIVRKWKFGTYRADGAQTSWVKIKNPNYSQAEGRGELFQKRNNGERRCE